MHLTSALTTVTVLLLTACSAGTPLRPAQVAEPVAAARAAEAVGAERYPDANAYLVLARRQLQEAETLNDREENEAAALVLERARADADLALALARAQRARAESAEATQRLHALAEGNR